jgi:hypothetical protein
VTLRARWVDAKSSLGDAKSSLGDAKSSLGAVQALAEKFEAALASLQDSGRLRALDACTVDDHGLTVDFEAAREELVELLDFTRCGGGGVGGADGVAGPLRGAAAMQVRIDSSTRGCVGGWGDSQGTAGAGCERKGAGTDARSPGRCV